MHAHLDVLQIQTLTVALALLVPFSDLDALWRVTCLVAFSFLFLLVLSEQVLMPRRVVVVREKLRQEQVHVWVLLAAVRNVRWPQRAVSPLHLREVLDVDVAARTFV